jgi:DeoR/GlpR family transcriptional regulator of sugar metabolism
MNSVEWRRSKVQELASQGYNQSEISRILQISQPTINRDITYLRQQAKPISRNTLTNVCQKNTRNVLQD